MNTRIRWGAALLVSVAIGFAPNAAIANADDPNLPAAGSENARATLNAITAAGYTPVLQYGNGVPNVGLAQCTVTNIDAIDASSGQGNVYVTINCPK